MAPIDAIPPLRAHDYAGRDWNVRRTPNAPKLRMAKAANRPPTPGSHPPKTPAPSLALDVYCPWRDESDGIHQ